MPKLSPGVGLASRDRMATWKSKGLVPSRGQQRTSRGQRSSSSTCSPQRLLNFTCAHRRRLLPRRSAISRRLNTNHRSSRSSKLLRQFGAFRSPCRAWYTTPPSSIANLVRAILCAALTEVRLVRPAPPVPPPDHALRHHPNSGPLRRRPLRRHSGPLRRRRLLVGRPPIASTSKNNVSNRGSLTRSRSCFTRSPWMPRAAWPIYSHLRDARLRPPRPGVWTTRSPRSGTPLRLPKQHPRAQRKHQRARLRSSMQRSG